MKRFFFFLVSLSLLASCKAPLPFYFDKPLGTTCNAFPEAMRGNYFSLDESEVKNQIVQADKYVIEGDTIYKKPQLSQRQLDSISRVTKDTSGSSTGNKKDSSRTNVLPNMLDPDGVMATKENSLIKMNGLKVEELMSLKYIDSYKMLFSYMRIGKNKIDLIGIDSVGKMSRVNLFTLSDKVKLTLLNGNYFINLSTPNGWEEMQLDAWHDKFMCVSVLYTTAYNEKAASEKEFLTSVKDLYPGLVVVYNDQKQIAGVKAKMDEKALLKLLERSEFKVYFIKK